MFVTPARIEVLSERRNAHEKQDSETQRNSRRLHLMAPNGQSHTSPFLNPKRPTAMGGPFDKAEPVLRFDLLRGTFARTRSAVRFRRLDNPVERQRDLGSWRNA